MNLIVKKNALVNVLVIGGGGREHALAWKLAQSNRVHKVFVAPGNGGTALDSRMENINIIEPSELLTWAATNDIALTLVGPEQPLAAGVVDLFRSKGMRIFGPTAAAAQLESSKAFSKAFMRRHGIPTADYDTFTDPALAHAFVDRLGAPIVVKADGLAAGKGVVVAIDIAEAHAAIDFMLIDNTLGVTHNQGGDGVAVPRVIIEQFLTGEEASFIVMCDGKNVSVMATSQDHKRLLDGDLGPNTGGMGAYSPAPIVTPDVYNRAMREVIFPTIKGMAEDGIPFTGFLYAGLMIETEGSNKGQIKTLEFNCRMGDPETQPIMMRLKSDFFEVLWAATEPGVNGQVGGRLDKIELEWDRRTALGVVMAAEGYPMSPRKGDVITGLRGKDASVANSDEVDAVVFHAGTVAKDGQTLTSGGRVLCVTVLAETVKNAQQRAYEVAQDIGFAGVQYRKDIGHKAIKS
jgi:phosphoribosylamine---glycine ligase